jgi:lysophospholipase L1-like esterase
MDQFGDSITAGDSGSGMGTQTNTTGDVDTLGVAANLGFAGATYGISGLTIEGLETALPTILAALPAASSADMAVLAIGRNDVGTGFDAPRQTYFNNIVDALLAKGYGRVICRAVLPDASSWDSFNTTMQSLVTARANPKVVYVPTSTWTGVTTSDSVHPDQAGYLTLRGYAITAYAPHIPA